MMNHFKVLDDFKQIQQNIEYLEQEGKTVVTLAVDGKPSLIISLEEKHLAKPEATFVVKFLQEVLNKRVCMITGDNKHSALMVANHLDIPISNVTYQAYPETKKDIVSQY